MKARIILICLLALALALAATASAQTKISGTIQCGRPDPQHAIDVGDRPNHSLGVAKVNCTWTKPMEMGGSQTKDGFSVASSEASGNRSQSNGYHVGTMASGDKFYVRYRGSEVLKEGAAQSAAGTWNFTRGTGKLKGIKGQGTYKGTANPTGASRTKLKGSTSCRSSEPPLRFHFSIRRLFLTENTPGTLLAWM